MKRNPYMVFLILLTILAIIGIESGCESKTKQGFIHTTPSPGTALPTPTGTGSVTSTGTGTYTGGGTDTGTGTGTNTTSTGTDTGTDTGPGTIVPGAGEVIIDISAFPSGVTVGDRFSVPININAGAFKIASYAVEITYDQTKLSVFAVQSGQKSSWNPLVKNSDTPGSVKLSGTNEDALKAYSGIVDICEIVFDAIAPVDATEIKGKVLQIKGQDLDAGPDILVFYNIGAPGERPISPANLAITGQ